MDLKKHFPRWIERPSDGAKLIVHTPDQYAAHMGEEFVDPEAPAEPPADPGKDAGGEKLVEESRQHTIGIATPTEIPHVEDDDDPLGIHSKEE